MGMIFLKYHEYNPWIKAGLQGKLGYTAFPLRGENSTTALARTGQRCGGHHPFSLPAEGELPDPGLLLLAAAPQLFPEREKGDFNRGTSLPPGTK